MQIVSINMPFINLDGSRLPSFFQHRLKEKRFLFGEDSEGVIQGFLIERIQGDLGKVIYKGGIFQIIQEFT